MFADDTNIFIQNSCYKTLISQLNNELENLSKWIKSYKLNLNIKKTHYMVWHRGKIKITDEHIVIINKSPVNKVSSTKFLGVVIDDKLSWAHHISYTVKKICKGLAILSKSKKYINKEYLVQLYNSFILPYLSYCVEIWGNSNNTHLKSIIKIQKKSMRLLTSLKHISTQTYNHYQVLQFHDLVKYKIGILMFKIYIGRSPKCVADTFKFNSSNHSHKTRNRFHLRIPKGNHEFIYKTFQFQGIYIWNFIIDNIDIKIPFNKFKTDLKLLLKNKSIDMRYSK